MRMKTAPFLLFLAVLVSSTASAHLTVRADHSGLPEDGILVPGQTYTVPTKLLVNCAVIGAEYEEGQTLVASIANRADFPWLIASEENLTVSLSNCEPYTEDPEVPTAPEVPEAPASGIYNIFDVDVSFVVDSTAPAFADFTFQPGADGEANQGGNFTAGIAYSPTFTVPTSLSFDSSGGATVAQIPLTMTANANSVFSFEVTSFTMDGADAPSSAMAHIQPTLDLETGIFSEQGYATATVPLHFGTSGGEMDMEGMDMSDMDMGSMDHGAMASGDLAWETAEVTLDITLAADLDPSLVSVPQTVVLTFNNVDTDTLSEETETEQVDGEVETPGFGVAAALAAFGAVAALCRRSPPGRS